MQLDIFEFVEDTANLLSEKSSELEKIEKELDTFFSETFFSKDHFIDVKTRVKAEDSLKEKILRNNLYLSYGTPEMLLSHLSDIIGVRIECRFIDDERKICNEIANLFRVKSENGYYHSFLNDHIFLDMDEKQPTLQKNGFGIYKIDGKYIDGDINYCFELQIKSLVNVFWGDIDHKILYKNFNYSLTERFIVDVMGSIKENLEMIDRELMLLYNHINDSANNSQDAVKNGVKVILSKNLHDIYYKKLRHDLGFTVDFRSSCDAIIDYLFMKIDGGEEVYMSEFLRLLKRMKFLESQTIDFQEHVEFPEKISYSDPFTKKIGERLKEIIRKDFNWSLFFRILFDIEEGDPSTIISELLTFIRNKYYEVILVALANQEIGEKIKSDIISYLMNYISDDFVNNSSIEIVSEKNISDVHNKIIKSMGEVIDLWDLEEIKKSIIENFDK